MNKKLIIAVLVLLGIAGSAVTYRWYLTTPLYSLMQIRSSIKNHDWETFNTLVNVDSMARGISSDLGSIIDDSSKDKVAPLLRKGLEFFLSLKIRSSLKGDLRAWVTGEPAPKNSFFGSILPIGQEGGTPNIKGITWKDDEGTASLGFKNGTVLVLGMKKIENTWQVLRIMNVRELYEESRARKKSQ